MQFHGKLSRRSFLASTSAVGLVAVGSTWSGKLLAQTQLPDPQSILDDISISKYVREDYQKLYNMSDSKPLWDADKDWIRNVDWEKVRSELSGTTVRFAVGAADAESAADGLVPFEALSGIKVELVPIPDDSMYDKVLAEFISGNASFDALQFFSPWMGDFAAPGFLYELTDFAEKWNLPLDDFYDTYRLNYGYFNGKMYGIPFDCDIQMVHLRNSYVEQVTGGSATGAAGRVGQGAAVRGHLEIARVGITVGDRGGEHDGGGAAAAGVGGGVAVVEGEGTVGCNDGLVPGHGDGQHVTDAVRAVGGGHAREHACAFNELAGAGRVDPRGLAGALRLRLAW